MDYNAGPTARRFHRRQEFVRAIIGPIGSGKSVCCCMDIMMMAARMPIGTNNTRRSRWLVARNTYRELEDTTLRTWRDWFPIEQIGVWIAKDMTHVIEVQLDDDTMMHLEVLFRSLDKPEDVKKLLSLELTGAWLNEAREMPKQVLDMLQGRVGRYPGKHLMGNVPQFPGCITLDSNPPDTDHWIYKTFEVERPEGWVILHQPSGLEPDAENIENLPEGYYQRLMQGHDKAWIDVYVHGKYGFVMEGKPVYPAYSDVAHVLEENARLLPGEIYLGVDFGLTPAAVIGQRRADGRWYILQELVTEDMDAATFADVLSRELRENYRSRVVHGFGDPAGDDRASTDKSTPIRILRAKGIPIVPCPFPGRRNDMELRHGAVNKVLTTMTMTAKPRLGISPRCEVLRRGLAGGYKYRRLQVAGADRFVDKPDKNKYSHVVEALEYLLVGAGESRELIKPAGRNKQLKAIPAVRTRRRAL